MTDYKSLKLIASSSPHIRSNEDTRSIMLDVIIALMPALIMGIYVFGWRALTVTLVSVAACVVWEWLYRKAMKKTNSIGDLSAVVTGILLAFVCPVQIPYWMIIIGAFFSIVLVKQLYGGIGCNFLNPALAGRAILLASYASVMAGNWVKVGEKALVVGSNADIVTAATPMMLMKGVDAAGWETLTSTYTLGDMFIGRIGGSLGEVSSLMLLLGGIYLLLRKVISWQTPVAFIATVAVHHPHLRSHRCQRRGIHGLQCVRRRPDAGCHLHGYRLCHLSRHQAGPGHLRYRLRPDHRVHPPLRLLSRGRLLLHHDHGLHHLAAG